MKVGRQLGQNVNDFVFLITISPFKRQLCYALGKLSIFLLTITDFLQG